MGKNNPVATSSTGIGPIPGWDASTVPPVTAWNTVNQLSPIKNTLNDPCPTGWRVLSRQERFILLDNTTYSYTGNANTPNIGSAAGVLTSKFNTGVKITLPFTGFRDGTDGRFSHAATGDGTSPLINGNYWNADENMFTLFDTPSVGSFILGGSVARRATPLRCVAEYPY